MMNYDDIMPMRSDVAYLLFLKAYELDISCHVLTENFAYFNFNDFQFNLYKNNGYHCRLVDMGRNDLGLVEQPLKFCLFCEDRTRLEQFKHEMQLSTRQSLSAVYSGMYTLEFTQSPSNVEDAEDDDTDLIQKYLLV